MTETPPVPQMDPEDDDAIVIDEPPIAPTDVPPEVLAKVQQTT